MESTALYNTLMGNPGGNAYNAIGRTYGSGNVDASNPLGFFQKRANSIENAIGTTLMAPVSGLKDTYENWSTAQKRRDWKGNIDDVYRKYGFRNRQDYDNQLYAAENAGNEEEANRLLNLAGLQEDLQAVANSNAAEADRKAKDYNAWRTDNSYLNQKINQDEGKFLGSAINTLSTATDVLGLTNGPVGNAIQGGIEGIADELEQNGLNNFSWDRAGQNALSGAVTGAATGMFNKALGGTKLGQGQNLFKGGNKFTKGLNDLGSKTALGRLGSSMATGATRGALSGAIGGATGGGLQAAMNKQDVLGGAFQGALQGAKGGAVSGAVMTPINSAIGNTNLMKNVRQAQQNWKNSGKNFGERFENTLNSGDSAVGNFGYAVVSDLMDAWGGDKTSTDAGDGVNVKSGYVKAPDAAGAGKQLKYDRAMALAKEALDAFDKADPYQFEESMTNMAEEKGLDWNTAKGKREFTKMWLDETANDIAGGGDYREMWAKSLEDYIGEPQLDNGVNPTNGGTVENERLQSIIDRIRGFDNDGGMKTKSGFVKPLDTEGAANELKLDALRKKYTGSNFNEQDLQSATPAQDAYQRGEGSFSDALNEFIEQGGNIVRDANGKLRVITPELNRPIDLNNNDDSRVFTTTRGSGDQWTFASDDNAPRAVKQAAVDYWIDGDGRVEPSELTDFYNQTRGVANTDIQGMAEVAEMESNGRVNADELLDFVRRMDNEAGNNVPSEKETVLKAEKRSYEALPKNPTQEQLKAYNQNVAAMQQMDDDEGYTERTWTRGDINEFDKADLIDSFANTPEARQYMEKMTTGQFDELMEAIHRGDNNNRYLKQLNLQNEPQSTEVYDALANNEEAPKNLRAEIIKNRIENTLGKKINFEYASDTEKPGWYKSFRFVDEDGNRYWYDASKGITPSGVENAKAITSQAEQVAMNDAGWKDEKLTGAKIKKILKNAGFDVNGLSIKHRYGGYSDSWDIDGDGTKVDLPAIERVLKNKLQWYETDERSGEILAGGNTFVFANDSGDYENNNGGIKTKGGYVNAPDTRKAQLELQGAPTEAETELYRQLTSQTGNEWDDIAKQNGYRNYDEAVQSYLRANPGASTDAGSVLDWMDQDLMAGKKVFTQAKNSDEIKYERAIVEEITDQFNPVSAPTKRSTKPNETFKSIYEDYGLSDANDIRKGVHYAEPGELVPTMIREAAGRAGVVDLTDAQAMVQELKLNKRQNYTKTLDVLEDIIDSTPSTISGGKQGVDALELQRTLEKMASDARGTNGTYRIGNKVVDQTTANNMMRIANNIGENLDKAAVETGAVEYVINRYAPEIEEMRNAFPDNKKWQKWVDTDIAGAKTIKQLRSAIRVPTRASIYIEDGDNTYGTMGSRLSRGAGTLAGGDIPTTKRGVINRGVNAIVDKVTNTPAARNARLKHYETKLSDARQARLDGGNKPVATETGAPIDTNTAAEPVANNKVTPESQQLYNAIGRTEGVINGAEARTAKYLTQASNDMNTDADTTGVAYTGGNTTYTTGTTGNLEQEKAKYFFRPTGQYWPDMLSQAMRNAKNAGDYEALGSLYEMYQKAVSGNSSDEKLTDKQRQANAAQLALQNFENAEHNLAYDLSDIPIVGGIANFGGNDYLSQAESLALQVGYMLSGATVNKDEARKIGMAYVPQPRDNEAVRRDKIERLRGIINEYQKTTA